MNLVEGEGASRNQKNVTKPDQKKLLTKPLCGGGWQHAARGMWRFVLKLLWGKLRRFVFRGGKEELHRFNEGGRKNKWALC
jgi:hypothetical protein